MIIFQSEHEFHSGLYKGLQVVATDNKSYGIVQLNGDPVVYLEIDYMKNDEDYVEISFQIGSWDSEDVNNLKDLMITKRSYDEVNDLYIDELKKFKIKLDQNCRTVYFLPVPITRNRLKISISKSGGSQDNDINMILNVKSQTFRA